MHSVASSFTPRRASLGNSFGGAGAGTYLGGTAGSSPSDGSDSLLSPCFSSSPSPFAKYYDEITGSSASLRAQRAASTSNMHSDPRRLTPSSITSSAAAAMAALGGSYGGIGGAPSSLRTSMGSTSSHYNSSTSPRASPQSSLSSFSSSPPPPIIHPMECTMEYLADLVREKKQLEMFLPQSFTHVERLIEEEINRVRVALFQCDFATDDLRLPEPEGEVISITEKLYVPRKEHPEYNFVGRILGPRGMTAKQLEQETGCKIMVRGKGSMRDKRKEEANRGKPNWEHLEDELHVLIQCEDTANRVAIKMRAAVEHVRKLLIPAPEGTDELKRKQLMELAIINGTYRPLHGKNSVIDHHRLIASTLLSASPTSTLHNPLSAYSLAGTAEPDSGSCTSLSNSSLHPSFAASVATSTASSNPFDYNNMMNHSFLESLISTYHLAQAASASNAASGAAFGGPLPSVSGMSCVSPTASSPDAFHSTTLLQALPANFFDTATSTSNSLF